MNNVKCNVRDLIDFEFYIEDRCGECYPIWMWHENISTSNFGTYFFPRTQTRRVYEYFITWPGILGTYGHLTKVDISPLGWHEVQNYIKACERRRMNKIEMIKDVLIKFQDFYELKFYADDKALNLLNGVE